MKHLTIYGASDDLIEVEGDLEGCDEYNGEEAVFAIAGLKVTVEYADAGVWAIKVAQLDEGDPVTAKNITLGVSNAINPENPPYSMQLDMDVPDDAVVRAT